MKIAISLSIFKALCKNQTKGVINAHYQNWLADLERS